MARTSGVFRRIIQLIVDAQSVARTKAQMQDALNKGTDAKGIKRNLKAIDGAMLALGRTATGVGAAILAAFSARRLVEMADQWKLIQGRLKLVTQGANDLKHVQDALLDISSRTRTEYSATATLFQRVALNAGELGRSQQEILSLTETLNKAIQLGGANAIEARAGVIQFSQAIASGVLRGDEFRSMMENLPGVAHALAEGLDVPVGKLREMAFAGELTAQRVTDALLKVSHTVDQDFANVPVTIGGAFTVLGNSIMEFVGQADEATGIASAFANALLAIANAASAAADKLDRLSEKHEARQQRESFSARLERLTGRPMGDRVIPLPVDDALADQQTRRRLDEERLAAERRAASPTGLLEALIGRMESERTQAIVKVKAASEATQDELKELNALYAEGNRFLREANISLEQRAQLVAALASLGFKEAEAKSSEEALKLEDERIKMLIEAHELSIQTADEHKELQAFQARFNAALKAGNLELKERLRIFEHIQDINAALEDRGIFRDPNLQGRLLADGIPDVRGAEPPGGRQIRARGITGMSRQDEEDHVQQWLDDHATMQAAAENAAMGVAGAWQDAFEAITLEGEGLAGFMEALFRGTAGAMLGGLAELAGAKVAENVARAFEESALASGRAAMFDFAGAAAHAASAKMHGLAAVKWAVLGGLAGAAQAGVSGGGRGGQSGGLPSGARDPAGRIADRLKTNGATYITIYQDPLDPNSGRYQTNVGEAVVKFYERRGTRITGARP